MIDDTAVEAVYVVDNFDYVVVKVGCNAADNSDEFVADYKLVFEVDESQNDFHDDQQLLLYDVSDNNHHY
jgi:hypothetical protein